MNLIKFFRNNKWIWDFVRPYKGRLILYFLFEIISLLSSLGFIYFSKHSIDAAVLANYPLVEQNIIGLLICLFLMVLSNILGSYTNEYTKSKMLQDLQRQVIESQMLSKWAYIRKWQAGDILNRIHIDCQEAAQILSTTIISIIVTCLRVLSAFIFLWWMDSTLAILILILSPLVAFSKIYYQRLKKINAKLKNEESQLSNAIQENLNFKLLVRSLNLNHWRWNQIKNKQDDVFKIKLRLIKLSIFSKGIISIVSNTGFIIAFLWGINSLYNQEITFGTLSAFLQLVSRIQGPLIVLMGFVPQLIRFSTTITRLKEVINIDTENSVDPKYFNTIQSIEVNQVTFAYQKNAIISNLNAKFEIGKPTSIIGNSGKGKTTLIRLLLSLFPPQQGDIFLTVDNNRIPLNISHRSNFGYVPQGEKLFSGTIRENLICDKFYTDQEILNVLNIACAEFVLTLPNGLNTLIGEAGAGLSEGQIQRIALARSLLLDAPIYLFDEVTSALDPQTSERLISNLIDFGKNKILIFITHDLKVSAACANVILI